MEILVLKPFVLGKSSMFFMDVKWCFNASWGLKGLKVKHWWRCVECLFKLSVLCVCISFIYFTLTMSGIIPAFLLSGPFNFPSILHATSTSRAPSYTIPRSLHLKDKHSTLNMWRALLFEWNLLQKFKYQHGRMKEWMDKCDFMPL